MTDGKVAAHIGCAKCGTVLFGLVAVPTGKAGVFMNEVQRREGVPEDASSKVCKCGQPLVRVSAPA